MSPMEALRDLALSLERLAAREAATGLVRGTAEGLREELPELDAQLRALLRDVLTVLGRLAREAAGREQVSPEAAAHTLAAAAMQGAIEVLEREWQNGGLPLHAFMKRLNRLLDEVVDFAHTRTDELRAPGDKARTVAESVVQAAAGQIHQAIPALREDLRSLAPLGAEVASHVGRGLVEGIESKLREDSGVFEGLLERAGRELVRGLAAGLREELGPGVAEPGQAVEAWAGKEAPRREGVVRQASREIVGGVLQAIGTRLRRPLLAVAGAGSALVALTLLSARWRRA